MLEDQIYAELREHVLASRPLPYRFECACGWEYSPTTADVRNTSPHDIFRKHLAEKIANALNNH